MIVTPIRPISETFKAVDEHDRYDLLHEDPTDSRLHSSGERNGMSWSVKGITEQLLNLDFEKEDLQ